MKYCVTYSVTTTAEAVVKAENEQEAKKRVKEIIPEAKIEKIWEIE